MIAATQNILNLSETLGEPQPGSKTKSFCGNLAIKIAHQQNEPDTAQFMADIIGKEYRDLSGWSGHEHSASVSGHQHLAHIVEPVEFTRLAKPDGRNPYAQAIVYQSGVTFNATKTPTCPQGRNYISVFFSREV